MFLNHRSGRVAACVATILPVNRVLVAVLALTLLGVAAVASFFVLRGSGSDEDRETAASPPPTTLSLPGEYVWRGDFETGDHSQWGSVQTVDSDRVRIVERPVGEGKYATRFEVRPGEDPLGNFGDRAELQAGRVEREGDERWYEWRTLFPRDYPIEDENVWQVVAQWHSTMDGVPPVSMEVSGNTIRFQTSRHDAAGNRLQPFVTVHWSAPLERGKWQTFRARIVWSGSDERGSVALWHNGKQVLKPTGVRTMYPGSPNFFKQGLYRCACTASTAILYHDGLVVTDAAEDVDVAR